MGHCSVWLGGVECKRTAGLCVRWNLVSPTASRVKDGHDLPGILTAREGDRQEGKGSRKRHRSKGAKWIKRRYWKTVGRNNWAFNADGVYLRFHDARKRIILRLPTEIKVFRLENRDRIQQFWKRRQEVLLNNTRMTGNCHVRFCERLRGKLPWLTRQCLEKDIDIKIML